MIKKSIFFFFFIVTLSVFIAIQYLFFQKNNALSAEMLSKKERFVGVVGLPDMAIVSEAHYVRHRSLSDTFSFFADAPSLLEYFPSTFVYNYSTIAQKNPSRIQK
ncbi:MAG: hypothetical protein PHN38_05425 [Sulfurospirillaceae bacterium]|nr:hypothetical protein [Sulfurospirillaceae bacterium]